jgi:hypothetical protein
MTSHQSSPTQSSRSSPGQSNAADEPSRKRRKVKRTRNGCLTCRKRRKLCDLERPLCGACVRLKLVCSERGSRADAEDCEWPAEGDDRGSSAGVTLSTQDVQGLRSRHFISPIANFTQLIPSQTPYGNGSAPWPDASMSDLMNIYGGSDGVQ